MISDVGQATIDCKDCSAESSSPKHGVTVKVNEDDKSKSSFSFWLPLQLKHEVVIKADEEGSSKSSSCWR